MQVKVANHLYQMGREEYQKLLLIAKEQVPFGIYAVQKKNYAELCNGHCQSISQLKKIKRQLTAQGFKVLANEGRGHGCV